VPKNLQLSAETETFTATLNYDTSELFGKIEASCEIVLASQ
jgi:hypothetical protein